MPPWRGSAECTNIHAPPVRPPCHGGTQGLLPTSSGAVFLNDSKRLFFRSLMYLGHSSTTALLLVLIAGMLAAPLPASAQTPPVRPSTPAVELPSIKPQLRDDI